MLVFQYHKITQLATHNRYHTASNVELITSLPLPALAASISKFCCARLLQGDARPLALASLIAVYRGTFAADCTSVMTTA